MNTTPPQPRVLVSWTIAPSSGQTVDGSNRRCSGPLQTATGQEEGGGRGFDQAAGRATDPASDIPGTAILLLWAGF